MSTRTARAFSFEFFPPKGESGAARLRETTRQLAPLKPHYVSVTFGAGGRPATAPTKRCANCAKPPVSTWFPTSRAWG